MTMTHTILGRAALTADELAAARQLMATCNAYDGLELKVATELIDGLVGPEQNAFLCHEDGKLVGYCALDGAGSYEAELCGMVDPAYRRRGIGRALLKAAREASARQGTKRLLLICEEAAAPGKAFVAAAGTLHTFSEYRMWLRHPRELPTRHADLVIELAGPNDVDAIAHITALAFGDPEDFVRARAANDILDANQHFYLARLAGVPIASLKVYPYENGVAGIYAFGVLPEHRGQGIGRQTLISVCERLIAEGRPHIMLEVETTNTTADTLYRSCGFEEATTYGYYALDV